MVYSHQLINDSQPTHLCALQLLMSPEQVIKTFHDAALLHKSLEIEKAIIVALIEGNKACLEETEDTKPFIAGAKMINSLLKKLQDEVGTSKWEEGLALIKSLRESSNEEE